MTQEVRNGATARRFHHLVTTQKYWSTNPVIGVMGAQFHGILEHRYPQERVNLNTQQLFYTVTQREQQPEWSVRLPAADARL